MNVVSKKQNAQICELFISSIYDEIDTYPCLGLVSKKNSGSHKDMDWKLFYASTTVLSLMLKELTKSIDDIDSFNDLRKLGKYWEDEMFVKTNNINTQKGLIFASLIFLYIYLKFKPSSLSKFSNLIKKFVKKGIKDIDLDNKTVGYRLYKEKKVKGAVFVAKSGYKIAFDCFKFYNNKINDLDINNQYKNFLLLLFITTNISDTTLLNKIGKEKYIYFIKRFKKVLKQINHKKLKELTLIIDQLNTDCVKENVSPGGAADILVLVLFLNKIRMKGYI